MTGHINLLSAWDTFNRKRGRKRIIISLHVHPRSPSCQCEKSTYPLTWCFLSFPLSFLPLSPTFPIHYFLPPFLFCSYFIPPCHTCLFPPLTPFHPPCSPSRVRPTRTGTPQRMTLSLWRTWTSWVDRRSCRRRRSWPWLWLSPWPRCRWRWRNRIARSHQWPTWSVAEIHSNAAFDCVLH